MTRERTARPGLAITTLTLIVAITAAWWALALWPVGAAAPEWLARTRAACFGARPGGLPDAGGWILLIGEPAGMAAVFIALWRQSLRSEIERLRRDRVWRVVASGVILVGLVAVALLGMRVARAYAASRPVTRVEGGVLTRLDLEPPQSSLIDQHGQRVSLADVHGHRTLLTFAFGHCTTVCPTVVRDVLAARRAAGAPDVRLIVVTLDPWRDTPDRLPYLARQWELASGDRVLSGDVAEVEATLDALGVGRRRNEVNGAVDHASTVMLLDARGRIAWRIDGWGGSVRQILSASP
jgi:cytochrome oxidase Cu insertion factor (SCO1/SenC/PrrC family)